MEAWTACSVCFCVYTLLMQLMPFCRWIYVNRNVSSGTLVFRVCVRVRPCSALGSCTTAIPVWNFTARPSFYDQAFRHMHQTDQDHLLGTYRYFFFGCRSHTCSVQQVVTYLDVCGRSWPFRVVVHFTTLNEPLPAVKTCEKSGWTTDWGHNRSALLASDTCENVENALHLCFNGR